MADLQERYTAAIVQHPPVVLDRDATVTRACELIAEAAAHDAHLVAFPESFVPVYPTWIYASAHWENRAAVRLHRRLAENSLEVGGEALERLQASAREHGVTVVIGATERDTRYSLGSLYNSLFFIGDDGALLGVHRKLMPTHSERLMWTPASDGSGLRTYVTRAGRLGGLICWEHWMPLSRFALHAAGEQVHVAAWPEVVDLHRLASRHYAFEGGCFVLVAGQYLRLSDLPDDAELRAATEQMIGGDSAFSSDPEVVFPGGSGIIGPDGEWIVGPAGEEAVIVYGEIDLGRIMESKYLLDTAGHYHRPDIFSLVVHASPRETIVVVDEPDGAEPDPG
jgi:nitrilase